MAAEFDPYHKWLGIPPKDQPPHHYRLLGIDAFEANPDVIESAADRQMSHLRTFQSGKHSALSQRLLNEVAAAKICLLNPAKKADYDARLHQLLDRPTSGDDTSTQLKGLQELGELLAQEAARPTHKPAAAKGANLMLVAVVGSVALAVPLVVWVWRSGQQSGRPADVAGSFSPARQSGEAAKEVASPAAPRVTASPRHPVVDSSAATLSGSSPAWPPGLNGKDVAAGAAAPNPQSNRNPGARQIRLAPLSSFDIHHSSFFGLRPRRGVAKSNLTTGPRLC